MASFDDLGRALRDDAAANAPDASVIDVDAVARAARARRRPRQWAVGALGLVAVLGVGGIAVAAATPPSLIAASESADLESTDLETTGAEDLGAPEADGGARALADWLGSCGAALPAADAQPVGLDLEAQLFSTPSAEGELTGTARVINTGTAPRTVVTRSAAWAVVAQDGVVVGGGSIVGDAARQAELDPGESLELPVSTSTRSCLDGTALAAGEYTVVVFVDTRQSLDEPEAVVISREYPLRLP
ncbi:hypothetical protein [Microcella sp.]|uniref:hypothetical protein n=1 Tax=Microcella sp. TaxID=1913979 RepID=UPI00391D5D87